MKPYDLIVIGAGSAARDAANKAAEEYGARVALVERKLWGGSCPNVACKPTKAYLVAAELHRDLRTLGGKLGLPAAPERADLARVHAWKETLRKPPEKWVQELRGRGFDTFEGVAAFVDPRTIRVEGHALVGERILIATGSRTAVPPVPGLDELDWIDHVTALDLEQLPVTLLVLGGGPVGLEFAQVFARFGSQVTLVQGAPRLSPRSDADATAQLEAALKEEGIDVRTETTVERFEGRAATLSDGRSIDAERVLLASGRVPNVEELRLDGIGVRMHRGGIEVNERLRTTVDGIWAAGDVTGLAQFTPIAQYQARIAVEDMFAPNGNAADYTVLPTAIFTDPELGAVGLTEHEAREQGLDVATAIHPLANVTRSQYVVERYGLYKLVYARETRRVLGIHVVSRGASDIVQGLSVALRLGLTVDDLARSHHVYPSWGEGVKAAAEQARPEPELRALST
ncbi:MAG: NAD(P)/FAD-dependent oxidoreductase [Actinobacteria bacterium]|nr:NAD(P)/FAD-dependent oxidoreductase [Actinomycetota bacterium]